MGRMTGTAGRCVTARMAAGMAAAALLLVACDGDTLEAVTGGILGEGSEDTTDAEAAEEPAADDTDAVDADTADADIADGDATDGAEDAQAADGPADLASAQAELDPWGPFDVEPFDVEIPDNPGEAILQIGDQRIEMATGQCRGGPVYEFMGEPIEASRASQGVFRFDGGASEVDGDLGVLLLLTEGVTAEGIEGEVMIRRAYQFDIVVPDGLPTGIRYQEFPGGRVSGGLEAASTSFADVPNIAITRDGLVTAQGTVERSASEFIDAPVEVSFAARCPQEWVDAIDELEAEFR